MEPSNSARMSSVTTKKTIERSGRPSVMIVQIRNLRTLSLELDQRLPRPKLASRILACNSSNRKNSSQFTRSHLNAQQSRNLQSFSEPPPVPRVKLRAGPSTLTSATLTLKILHQSAPAQAFRALVLGPTPASLLPQA